MQVHPDTAMSVVPLVMVFSCDKEGAPGQAGQWVLDWLQSTSMRSAMRVKLVRSINYRRKNKEGRSSDGRPLEGSYEVRGLLKKSWLRRQCCEMSGVIVAAVASSKLSSCDADRILESLRSEIGNREVALVLAVLVETDGEDEEDRAARKRLVAVGANMVLSRSRHNGFRDCEARAVLELARGQYSARARRVRKWEKTLRSPVLLARYAYKQGWWHEFAGEEDKAIRAFTSCYAQLQHAAILLPDQAHGVADYANLRLCRLLLRAGRPFCAANQMATHLATLGCEHPAWRCTQHLLFAQLLAAAPTALPLTPHTNSTTWSKPAQRAAARQINGNLETREGHAFCQPSYHYAATATWAARCRNIAEEQRCNDDPAYSAEWVVREVPQTYADRRASFFFEVMQQATNLEKRSRFASRLRAGIWTMSSSGLELQDPASNDNSLEWAGPLVRCCGSLGALGKLATLSGEPSDATRTLEKLHDDESASALLEELWQLEATWTGSQLALLSNRVSMPPPEYKVLRLSTRGLDPETESAIPPPLTNRAIIELSAEANPVVVKRLRAKYQNVVPAHILDHSLAQRAPAEYNQLVVPFGCLFWLELAEASLELCVERQHAHHYEGEGNNLGTALAPEPLPTYMRLDAPPLGWLVVPKQAGARLLATGASNALRLALHNRDCSNGPRLVGLCASAPVVVIAHAERIMLDFRPAVMIRSTKTQTSTNLVARLSLRITADDLLGTFAGNASPSHLFPGEAAALPTLAKHYATFITSSRQCPLRLTWQPPEPLLTPRDPPPCVPPPQLSSAAEPTSLTCTTLAPDFPNKDNFRLTGVEATLKSLTPEIPHSINLRFTDAKARSTRLPGKQAKVVAPCRSIAFTAPLAETPLACQLVVPLPPFPALEASQFLQPDNDASPLPLIAGVRLPRSASVPIPYGLHLRLTADGNSTLHPLSLCPLAPGRVCQVYKPPQATRSHVSSQRRTLCTHATTMPTHSPFAGDASLTTRSPAACPYIFLPLVL